MDGPGEAWLDFYICISVQGIEWMDWLRKVLRQIAKSDEG
jgi:hypothetical protein